LAPESLVPSPKYHVIVRWIPPPSVPAAVKVIGVDVVAVVVEEAATATVTVFDADAPRES
jgi:hypothetical protein